MFLIALLMWAVVVVLFTRLLVRWIKAPWIKGALFLVIAPVIFLAPAADELIGKVRYDALCKAAEDVKVVGAIPVREPFYTEDGTWLLPQSTGPWESDRRERILNAYDALVWQDSVGPIRVPAAMPIDKYEIRIVSRTNGKVLAFVEQYATHGGWLSQRFETPAFVRAQCFPPEYGEKLKHRILPFKPLSGDKQ